MGFESASTILESLAVLELTRMGPGPTRVREPADWVPMSSQSRCRARTTGVDGQDTAGVFIELGCDYSGTETLASKGAL